MTPALELIGINKSFGPVHANRDVSLAVRPGSIHGIVGENGAGKSTLMSIVYGFHEADSGAIQVAGKPVRIASAHDSIGLGIGMVHQHFMLVGTLSVLENVMLRAEGGRFLGRGAGAVRPPNPRLKTANFSGGNQQKIVLAREMERDPKVVLAGQPTRGVDIGAIEFIHKRLVALRDEGNALLVVSVELDEVLALGDIILCMCGGRLTGSRRPPPNAGNDADFVREPGLLMAGVTDEAA